MAGDALRQLVRQMIMDGYLYQTADKSISLPVSEKSDTVWLSANQIRTGRSKEEIKDYIVKEFGYDLSCTCDEIRPEYRHVESCQKTAPGLGRIYEREI